MPAQPLMITRPAGPVEPVGPTGSTLVTGLDETLAMIGRSLRQKSRQIDSLLMSVFLPVMLLLLFVYVFGGAIATNDAYIDYVVPGIILLSAGFGAAGTAVSVCHDMVGGSIDRFRSMPILSSSVLSGHVVASVAGNLLSTAVVILVALLMGFSPTAGLPAWLGVIGVLVLFMIAISWVSAALGLVARTVEAANGFTFFVLFLPYVSSAFVPTGTMPGPLRWFAEHQPITPVIETVRSLLIGRPVGSDAWLAVSWCVAITVVAYVDASWLFRRRTAR